VDIVAGIVHPLAEAVAEGFGPRRRSVGLAEVDGLGRVGPQVVQLRRVAVIVDVLVRGRDDGPLLEAPA